MDFLKELKISDKTINALYEKYDEAIMDLFKLEKENVKDNIIYFERIGITDIEDILKAHIEVFTKNPEEVKSAFEKYNIKSVVEKINIDPTWITQI